MLPAWLRSTAHESRVPVASAIVVAAALQLVLAQQFTLIRPRWLLPSLEIALSTTVENGANATGEN